jgi:hypothetical protein
MWVALIVSTLALVLLAVWLMQIRVRQRAASATRSPRSDGRRPA